VHLFARLFALGVLLAALMGCDIARAGLPTTPPASEPLATSTPTSTLPWALSRTPGTATTTPPVAATVAVSDTVCGYDEAKAVAEAFLDAYNHGDQRALAGFFGRKFMWYSATNAGEPHFVAHQPERALAYFERRHALGEWLALREFHLTSADPTAAPHRDTVDFWYYLDRTVEGQTLLAMGKGAMDCAAHEIFVWSMGTPPPGVGPTAQHTR
jgi:hypothetical protein